MAKLKIQIKNLGLKTTVTDGFSIYQADFAGCESDVMQWLDKVGIGKINIIFA